MTYYISQGRAETPIGRGGQSCCISLANLIQYTFAKDYENIMRFDKVISKLKKVQFFCQTLKEPENTRNYTYLSKMNIRRSQQR